MKHTSKARTLPLAFGPSIVVCNIARLVVLCLCLVTLQSVSGAGLGLPPQATRSRPFAQNILLIISDDLKPNIASYGNQYADTPNIDRLAARGVRFSRAFTQYSNCGPSRASFLTSMRPDTTRVYDNNDNLRTVKKTALTVSEIFRFSGYRVFGMGKIGDGRVFGPDEYYYDANYPAYDVPLYFNQNGTNCFDLPRPYCKKSQGWNPDNCKCVVSPGFTNPVNEDIVPAFQRYPNNQETDYIDERMGTFGAQMLTKLLNDNDPTPFLLIVGLTKPHLPYAAPYHYFSYYDGVNVPLAPWRTAPRGPTNPYALKIANEVTTEYTGADLSTSNGQKAVIRANYACISFVDTQVGKLLAAWDNSTSSKRDNLMVIMTADHGFHLGEQGHWGKHTVLEQGTRVPLLIVPPLYPHPATYASGWRSNMHAGKVVRTPVELLDLVPTMMDLAGLFDAPQDMMGAFSIKSVTASNSKLRTGNSGRKLAAASEVVRQMAFAQTEGKSLRQFLLGEDDFRKTQSALAVSMYVRGGGNGGNQVYGYAIRTERYRYIQWFKANSNFLTSRAVAEELYDYLNDPNETNNIVDVKTDTRQRMRKLYLQFMSSDKVFFDRLPDEDTSNEDLSMVNQTIVDPLPQPQLMYFQNWMASTEAFFNPSLACQSAFTSCFPVQHVFTLPDPTTITYMATGSINVVRAIKLALKALIDGLNGNSNSQGGRRLAQQLQQVGGVSIQEITTSGNSVRFQVDLPTMDEANALVQALKQNSLFFDYSLNAYLDGTIADAGLQPKTGISQSNLNSGYPKVVMATTPTTPPPPTQPPSSNSPTPQSTTSSPTTPATAPPTSTDSQPPTLAPTDPDATASPVPDQGTTPAPSSETTTLPPALTFPPTSRPTPHNSTSSAISGGAVAGIVIGSLFGAFALFCVVPYFCLGMGAKRKRQLPEPNGPAPAQPRSPANARGSPASSTDKPHIKEDQNLAAGPEDDEENEKTVVGEDPDTAYVTV